MKALKIVLVIVTVSFLSPSFATEGNFFGQVGEFLENLDVEFTITAPVVQHQTNQQNTNNQYPVIQRPVTVPCNNGNGRGNGRGNCNRVPRVPRAPVTQQPTQVYVPVVVPRTIVQQPVYTPVQQPVYTQPVYTQPVYTAPVQQPATHTTTTYTNTTTANSGYHGFATYQDYLDSFYAQNGGNAYTGSTTTSNCNCEPTQTTTTHAASSGYEGYATYQDYIDAYYAADASHTGYEAVQPTYTAAPTIHTDTSDTYMGYASYQDYLDHYHSSSASATNSSSYGSGYVDSSTSYVASTQISTTPIHVPTPVAVAAPIYVAPPVQAAQPVVGYTATTSINYSHLPTGHFNLGYEQGYIINSSTRLNLVDIERGSAGQNVLVLRVIQNNQPRQVRVNLAQDKQTVLQIGGKRLQVVGLERVNNRNVVRCYLVN